MSRIEGYVDYVRFRNEDNGYTVLSLDMDGDEETVVGMFQFIHEGEFLSMDGDFVDHPVHGPQFQMKTYEITMPNDITSMERYLGSGAVKGIGPALAKRIVKKFKMDTFRVMEEEPERLSEVKGISERKSREMAVEFSEKQEMRQAMMFLSGYGINTNLAVKIFKEYGEHLYEVVRTNPYQMTDDIDGVGFKIADEIAQKVGIGSDSDFRIVSGIFYVLMQALGEGHVYLPKEILCRNAGRLLGVAPEDIESHLLEMMIQKKIVMKEEGEETFIYAAVEYYLELNVAKMLRELNIDYDVSPSEVETMIGRIESNSDITFAPEQKEALEAIARYGIVILTGGPGTGKTTTINGIIQYFEQEGADIRLAAPTGRAAKRMTEATGVEATTIHRMLEITGGAEDGGTSHFERNEQNPLETDVIIIDEMSMVDLQLMSALLRAAIPGTRFVFVGDSNQLPSVGAGNVLRDMIDSKEFKVVQLNQIFRQEEGSHIVSYAHAINEGQPISMDNKSKDFFFLERESIGDILGVMIYLVRDKLPKYVNAHPYDIQVLTPMRKGELGVEKLNQVLQEYLNPPSEEKMERHVPFGVLREGDKVMQIKNNYQQEWKVKNQKGFTVDEGLGVFNGDMGRINQINEYTEKVTVVFDDIRVVEYPFAMLDELELAYAVTIHKSQGSEYPAVVMPLLTGPRVLFNRNLLYTGVTRAKSCIAIVGRKHTVGEMIANVNEQRRYSTLRQRICEIAADELEM
ncbi:MAG: ATP-dependent RecD-like DNA helicase [Anaerostipes sp.]|nr:ATP-dependent RecD-like DNA helicase [Anaerostipes sp.]